MSRKHNVIKQKTKTQLAFNISQRETKELYCPVSADESQIKEVRIDLFEHFDFSPEKFKTARKWQDFTLSNQLPRVQWVTIKSEISQENLDRVKWLSFDKLVTTTF